MSTVNGKLFTLINFQPEIGEVEVALCGYGSQVPRVPSGASAGEVARVSDAQTVTPDNTGAFEFEVVGNDHIKPDGTYYTVTIKDSNGDVIQVNAYQFNDYTNYDLATTAPFDPSAGPPSVAPFILNLLEVVPYAPNPYFSGDQYTAWEMTLTGDSSPGYINLIDGNLYTMIVIQDSAGGHAYNWAANVHNATWVSPDPNAITIQTFVALDGDLYAIAAGTYYP